jgi:hypothetical protein
MKRKLLPQFLVAGVLLTLCGCGGSSNTSSGSASPAGAQNQASSTAAVPRPQPIVIPDGTTIVVTVDQTLSSGASKLGDRFPASFAEPVMVDGKQAIPRGAKASGTVRLVNSAGKIEGSAELGVSIDSVTVNGRSYDIQTRVVREASSGRGKRTAIGAGAGAAAGAIIGAIAGGGKGAAIGGAAGAGAGTAGAAFTGKRNITIPAETTLHFEMTAPLPIEQQ